MRLFAWGLMMLAAAVAEIAVTDIRYEGTDNLYFPINRSSRITMLSIQSRTEPSCSSRKSSHQAFKGCVTTVITSRAFPTLSTCLSIMIMMYPLILRRNDVSDNKLACVAVFSDSFQASESHAKARGQREQKKIRSRGRGIPFLPTPPPRSKCFALAPYLGANSPRLSLSTAKKKRNRLLRKLITSFLF